MSFLVPEIIKKKRDGLENSPEEIRFLVEAYTKSSIPDYQVSAWLMAVLLKGMTDEETHTLTQSMLHSGKVLDFSHLSKAKIDKHSTGGVGDKTSMILGPIVAACDVAVPMISGRGLGHTGGTLDKLESIPGFNTQVSEEFFLKLVEKEGLCFAGQTKDICPADKKIYALRDVTGTVESQPLICASIMSKKLAEGIDGLVLDVKVGSGAFMKNLFQAEGLAKKLMAIGKQANKKVCALLSNMDQPLGQYVGNALEIQECLSILKNENHERAADTLELSLQLASHMVHLGKNISVAEARAQCEKALSSGIAFEKFEKICLAQGGQLNKISFTSNQETIVSKASGYIEGFQTESIGMAALALGAGRQTSSDVIDYTAGIEVLKKTGEAVKAGEPIYVIHGENKNAFATCKQRLLESTRISAIKVDKPNLILKILL